MKLSISEGASCSFSIFGERALFEASVSWYLVTENNGWRDNFKRECVKLGENPSNPDTIDFFKRFGTHGLKHARLGKQCTEIVTMEGEITKHVMQEWSKSSQSRQAGYGWSCVFSKMLLVRILLHSKFYYF